MHLSVATANLYQLPFEQALAIIAEAGFECIELDLFWERKQWAMAQHLKDIPARRAVQIVQQAGLTVTSIHDGGGVLEEPDSPLGHINPILGETLDELGYAPDCLVFHTPHVEGRQPAGWWEAVAEKIVDALAPYQRGGSFITLENMPLFEGYTVPLTTPEALGAFARQHGLGITLDTTHYAQIGVDIIAAAQVLNGNVKTIHLSDYQAGQTHVFIGEGELDFPGFFTALGTQDLNAVTLECSLARPEEPGRELGYAEMVSRMRLARTRMVELVG